MRISIITSVILAFAAQGAISAATKKEKERGPTPSATSAASVETTEATSAAPAETTAAASVGIPSGPDALLPIEFHRKQCHVGFQGAVLKHSAQQAIDLIRLKPGFLVLDTPGCLQVACASDAAVDVCFEPVENGPERVEYLWWHVADFAEKLSEEWCPGHSPHPFLIFQGGKAWDPHGFALESYDLGDDECSAFEYPLPVR